MPVERSVAMRNDRPGARVGGGFAGAKPGFELFEGGVDIVGVEGNERDEPLVGVDLD